MPGFDDERWSTLTSGYGSPYDARPALLRVRERWDDEDAWAELWDELHHQGDVGTASYAAVAALVDLAPDEPDMHWNLFRLAMTVEAERHRVGNPAVPDWIANDYGRAWRRLVDLALRDLRDAADPEVVRDLLAVVALGRGATRLGALLGYLDESEIVELADDLLGWTDIYSDAAGALES